MNGNQSIQTGIPHQASFAGCVSWISQNEAGSLELPFSVIWRIRRQWNRKRENKQQQQKRPLNGTGHYLKQLVRDPGGISKSLGNESQNCLRGWKEETLIGHLHVHRWPRDGGRWHMHELWVEWHTAAKLPCKLPKGFAESRQWRGALVTHSDSDWDKEASGLRPTGRRSGQTAEQGIPRAFLSECQLLSRIPARWKFLTPEFVIP